MKNKYWEIIADSHRHGSGTRRSERISHSVVCLSLPIYMQIRRELDTLADAKKEERVKVVWGCFERSAALLKKHSSILLSFHALSRAEGHRLESNEEVAEVCDLIQGARYDHPFEGISPGYVPEKDWLSFLKHVKHAPNINPEDGKDYIGAANRRRQDDG